MLKTSPSKAKFGKVKWHSPDGKVLEVGDRFPPKEYCYRYFIEDPLVQIHAWPFAPIKVDKVDTQPSYSKWLNWMNEHLIVEAEKTSHIEECTKKLVHMYSESVEHRALIRDQIQKMDDQVL